MIRAFRIGIIVLIQAAVLMFMVYDRAQTLETGTPVFLKTRPVDPRSLFRGHYVDLDYEIGRLTIADLEGDRLFERHQPIFVTLETRDDHWGATGIYTTQPRVIGNQVVIKGTVDWVTQKNALCAVGDLDCDSSAPRIIDTVSVNYGIDSYFIPEGDGQGIEALLRTDRDAVRVGVAINDAGKAAIRGLQVDGQWLYEEPPY